MDGINLNKLFVAIEEIADKYKDELSPDDLEYLRTQLSNQELRIAVIGKMKAGKSTFTNALIFQDEILAASAETTTVTLTEIGYLDDSAKKAEIQVETLTSDDIKNLERRKSEGNEDARKILEELGNIPGGYEQHLGKNLNISADELAEYTSASGKLSGLAKRAVIKINNDLLKGITVIDTPGFNDPIESRVETTRHAVSKCQIVFFVHDTLSKYDKSEMSMLTEQIEKEGTASMVDIINRMDENDSMSVKDWPEYRKQVTKVKAKILETLPQDSKVYELLKSDKIVCVSSYIALLGHIVKKRGADVDSGIKKSFTEYQCDFEELKTADDFIKWSYIPEVIKVVNELSSERSRILARSPIEILIGKLKIVADKKRTEIKDKKAEIDDLNLSGSQAEERYRFIDGIFRPVMDSISTSSLHSSFDYEISQTKRSIQDKRETASRNITKENYPEPRFLHKSTDKKNNLSNYVNILLDFIGVIRNEEYDLKDKFRAMCDKEVNRICTLLISKDISDDNKEYLENFLRNKYSEFVNQLDINVHTSLPQEPLEGNNNQYSIYKSDFFERFKDSTIDDDLESFKNHNLFREGFIRTVQSEFGVVKERLRSSIKFDPVEKDRKIREVQNEIDKINNLLEDVNNDIVKLNKLKNENNA